MLRAVYDLKYKNELLKKDLTIQKEKCQKELYKQKSEILEKYQTFAQDIAKTTTKTAHVAVSGLAYAKKNYTTAPELKKLDEYDLGDDDELTELLLFYSREGKIAEYIGDFIIKFYKKDDPNNQSLWNTDTSRLTFIIRQIMKKKNDWHYDKKGIKVCKIIINPLLDNIKTILKEYISDINDKIIGNKNTDSDTDSEIYDCESDYKKAHKELDNNDKLKLVNDQKTAIQIITEINNKTLSEDIIKYISPRLSLVQDKE